MVGLSETVSQGPLENVKEFYKSYIPRTEDINSFGSVKTQTKRLTDFLSQAQYIASFLQRE